MALETRQIADFPSSAARSVELDGVVLRRGGEGWQGSLESLQGLEDEGLNGGRLIHLEIEAESSALDMGVNSVALALREGLNERKLGDT